MKKFTTTLAILAASAVLAGCSSAKLGAFCYVEYGAKRSCSVTTPDPATVVVATPAAENKP